MQQIQDRPITDLVRDSFVPEDVTAATDFYTMELLSRYDHSTHVVNANEYWKLPTATLLERYNRLLSANHLEVGAGSGYLPDNYTFPSDDPQISLLDFNPNTLRVASHRIRRYPNISLYRANVLEPIPLDRRFDSIGFTYVMHCLPGTMDEKGVSLGNLKTLLAPGGVLFGATVLYDEFLLSFPEAREKVDRYIRQKTFQNRHDTLEGLQRALSRYFTRFELESVGCVGIFIGHNE